ncbi:MAG: ECF transporter S component [Oscillospiraceae bacterium]|nr:ECF transporter S component [Oscillospiraceae bacterium]
MKFANIKRMVGIALLMAMVVVLQFVSSMIPPLFGMVSISLSLIPVVLGAAVFGPGAGVILGATFGVVVTINSITGADPGGAMVFQANPALCIMVIMAKGVLAGLASGWVYKLLKNRSGYIAMLLAAIVCPLVNTGVFLVCMALFFMDVLSAWAGGGDVLGYVLSILVLCNFVPELVINVVFSPAGQRIAHTVEKK